jgi:hypothetical protein
VPGSYLRWLLGKIRSSAVRRAVEAELARREQPCDCMAGAPAPPPPPATPPANDSPPPASTERARQCLAAVVERATGLLGRLDAGYWVDGTALDAPFVFALVAAGVAAFASLDADNIAARARRAREGRQPLGVIGGPSQ